MTTEPTKCELCGEPMPPGETMFKFHGYSGPCPKPPLEQYVPDGHHVVEDADGERFVKNSDEEIVIDESWLASLGWVALGNTWYPPERSHPRQYDCPILMWIRVDGTIRLGGNNPWTSSNDAKRGQLRTLCDGLEIRL